MPTSVAWTLQRALVAALLTGALGAAAACAPSRTAPESGPATPAADPAEPERTDPPAVASDHDDPHAPGSPTPRAGPSERPPPDERPAPDDQAEAASLRGAWVHLFDDTLKSRAGIAALVDDLVAADATAVIAQVARRHDAYYRSEVLPPTPDPDLEPGLDVLDELLRRAHPRGIEVHAWVTVAPTWHQVYEGLQPPDDWLPASHGQDAPAAARWVSRTVDGEWSEFLDPALPQVRDHVARVAAELAARYPVDGVHLDYVRYASERHGYHPDALARYRSETGATGTPAPNDPEWSAWRRARTREIVEAAGAALRKAGGADVALSAAVVTWGPGPGSPQARDFEDTRPYGEALQDWVGWARDGLVDAVMPMNYFRAHEADQAAWLAQWERFQRDLGQGAAVVPGVGGWLNAPDAVVEQVQRAMRDTSGAVVYSYQQPTDDEAQDVWGRLAESQWGAIGPGD